MSIDTNHGTGRALVPVPAPQDQQDTFRATVRKFLGAEAIAFLVASLVHRGFLVEGYAHWRAAVAETVIATVLAAGFAGTFVFPRRPLAAAWPAQIFAVIGALIGIFVSIRGIGPHTVADAIYHAAMLLTLLAGAWTFARR